MPTRPTAEALIAHLQLEPLPLEGGYFRQTWRSPLTATGAEPRPAGTAILMLITPEGFSAFHRLGTDEVWHFYAGDPLEQWQLHPDGSHTRLVLGPDVLAGQHPQHTAPAHSWQGTRLLPGGQWALFGATMAPGFTWSDFELGKSASLLHTHPACAEAIRALTRPD